MSKYSIKLEGRAETYQDLLRILIDVLGNLNAHEDLVRKSGFRMTVGDRFEGVKFDLDVSLEEDKSCGEMRNPDAGIHGMGNVFGR